MILQKISLPSALLWVFTSCQSGLAQEPDRLQARAYRAERIHILQSESQQVITHPSNLGEIICKDPQVPYSYELWNFDDRVREHMLVDLLESKAWLQKTRGYIEKSFPKNLPNPGSTARYALYVWSRCGNTPELYLEVVYDKDNRVEKYRATYKKDGASVFDPNGPGKNSDKTTAWVK